MMRSPDSDDFARLRELWDKTEVVRGMPYSLFTFGETTLPYFVIAEPPPSRTNVSVRRGQIRINRPMIITPNNAPPVLRNFFEDQGEEAAVSFLLARQAAFSNLRLANDEGGESFVTDSVNAMADRLCRQLDEEDEDRVAVLTAPFGGARIAVLRYAIERVAQSASDNVAEMRERGFLP